MTVDVEDFGEGMAVLGARVEQSTERSSDLGALLEDLQGAPSKPRITLFVVGTHAERTKVVRSAIEELVAAGHEVASHGPDHGTLPRADLVAWLAHGRDMLEQMFQTRVRGFRSPRFDLPPHGDLLRYRAELAEGGFEYVSDTHLLGPSSAVAEAPVLSSAGVKVGGGSYQRMLPTRVVDALVRRSRRPAVAYYHSYDFDQTVPGLSAVRSAAMARQVLGRKRVRKMFSHLLHTFGSESCSDAFL